MARGDRTRAIGSERLRVLVPDDRIGIALRGSTIATTVCTSVCSEPRRRKEFRDAPYGRFPSQAEFQVAPAGGGGEDASGFPRSSLRCIAGGIENHRARLDDAGHDVWPARKVRKARPAAARSGLDDRFQQQGSARSPWPVNWTRCGRRSSKASPSRKDFARSLRVSLSG